MNGNLYILFVEMTTEKLDKLEREYHFVMDKYLYTKNVTAQIKSADMVCHTSYSTCLVNIDPR